jgi:alpha-beta hydrolase superfamily lysophospholipase
MKQRELPMTGVGGVRLYTRSWLPDGDPVAVIAISHGLGEHCGRYEALAARLVDRGHAVYAMDHRGHGRSDGARANIERFAHVVADFSTFAGHAAREHPGLPVFMLGHSMGGAIAFASAAHLQDVLSGLVLSAPALGAGDAVSPLQLKLVRLLSAVAPNVGALRLPPTSVSRDPAIVRAYEEDPLVFHKAVPARTVAELVAAMATFPEIAAHFHRPILIQHGRADTLVPLAATHDVYHQIRSHDRTVRIYDELYHEVYNEPERETVIADLLEWLETRRPL